MKFIFLQGILKKYLYPLLLHLNPHDHNLTLIPSDIFKIKKFNLNFFITNSILSSFFISFLILLLFYIPLGLNFSLFPNRAQMCVEMVITIFEDILTPIIGKNILKKILPTLLTFFIFIFFNNLSGLFPILTSIGHINKNGNFIYLFRTATSDLNTTIALSIISFIIWVVFTIKYSGINFIKDIFGVNHQKLKLPFLFKLFLFLIFIFVGLIEIISILIRPISLAFRLFGNVFGGEQLMINIYNLCPYILPIPFYFLEIILSLVQSLVFTFLLAIYIGLSCHHND